LINFNVVAKNTTPIYANRTVLKISENSNVFEKLKYFKKGDSKNLSGLLISPIKGITAATKKISDIAFTTIIRKIKTTWNFLLLGKNEYISNALVIKLLFIKLDFKFIPL
tara:strand:- start:905 stop:1234 length:330 start_codon:yes stop_codon:yes gene_type:complete